MGILRRNEICIFLLMTIILIITSFAIFSIMKQDNPHISNVSNQTIYIKLIPVSLKPLNQTIMTSLVSSTDYSNNKTILHLANGINIPDNANMVRSGDTLSVNATIYKTICSLTMSSSTNKTIENNTVALIQSSKDPRCQDNLRILNINEWHKVNQK